MIEIVEIKPVICGIKIEDFPKDCLYVNVAGFGKLIANKLKEAGLPINRFHSCSKSFIKAKE